MDVGIIDPAKFDSTEDEGGHLSGYETGATPTDTSYYKLHVSADASLQESAMSASSLSAMSFELPASLLTKTESSSPPSVHHTHVTQPAPHAIPISSASSTCTRESDGGALSDAEAGVLTSTISASPVVTLMAKSTSETTASTPVRLDRAVSDQLNAKVSQRKTSRQGRSSQRWVTSDDGKSIRLVTGCVPILRGGKILFVSASRKAEWIIPKGGWEMDETLEESAVRECFEEAGVLGILGPQLTEIQYETRKAKKRRLLEEQELEQEQQQKRLKTEEKMPESSPSNNNEEVLITTNPSADAPLVSQHPLISNETIVRIRDQAATSSKQEDEKLSTASTTYSQARMTLFPLYVSQVLEEWPESGRLRKAVEIDQAIAMLDSRPELKAVLEEVKQRGLHLVVELPAATDQQQTRKEAEQLTAAR